MSKIKTYFWMAVIGIALIFVAVVLKDQSTVAKLESLLRRKKVEDEVNEIKTKLKLSEEEASKNEDKLVQLAEKLKEDQKSAKNASEKEIKEFWDDYFN